MEQKTPLWAPRILDARPKGVVSKGKVGESRGDRKPYLVSCPLLPLSVGTDTPGPPKAANVHAHLERKLASSGAPLYRRKI